METTVTVPEAAVYLSDLLGIPVGRRAVQRLINNRRLSVIRLAGAFGVSRRVSLIS